MGKYPSHILVTWPGYDLVITSIMRSWTTLHEVFLTTGESQQGSYDQPYRQRLQRFFQPFYHFWGILHPASAMLTFNHAAHEPCLA